MPAGRNRDAYPSIAGYPLAITAIVGTAFAVALFAAALPSPDSLPRLPHLRLAAPNLGSERLPGVRTDVIENAFDPSFEALIAEPGRSPHTEAIAGRGQAPGPRHEPQRPSRERGALTGALAPGEWAVHAAMSSDRPTARPGDDITYTVTVTNVGHEPFLGDVAIESHIPFRTSSNRTLECAEEWVGGVAKVCRAAAIPVPGLPSETLHAISTRAVNLALAPGESWHYTFSVTVDRAAVPGTLILNHGHVRVAAEPPVDTDPVEVVVI